MTPEREAAIRSYAKKNPQSWPAMTFRELLEALDQERARVAQIEEQRVSERAQILMVIENESTAARVAQEHNAKLERVAEAARGLTPPCDYESDYDSCAPSCATCPKSELCAALATLETPDE